MLMAIQDNNNYVEKKNTNHGLPCGTLPMPSIFTRYSNVKIRLINKNAAADHAMNCHHGLVMLAW